MPLLTSQDIRSDITIEPFTERKFHPNGLTFGLGPASYEVRAKIEDDDGNSSLIFINQGSFASVLTLEEITIPDDVVVEVKPTAEWLDKGVTVTVGEVASGFSGRLSLQLANLGTPIDTPESNRVLVNDGVPIARVEFIKLDAIPDVTASSPIILADPVPDVESTDIAFRVTSPRQNEDALSKIYLPVDTPPGAKSSFPTRWDEKGEFILMGRKKIFMEPDKFYVTKGGLVIKSRYVRDFEKTYKTYPADVDIIGEDVNSDRVLTYRDDGTCVNDPTHVVCNIVKLR